MMKPKTRLALVALVVAAGLAIGTTAAAQDKGKPKKGGGGPVVLEEIVIEGRVQKPQAFLILQRSNFGFQVMELRTEYLDDIQESVKDGVF